MKGGKRREGPMIWEGEGAGEKERKRRFKKRSDSERFHGPKRRGEKVQNGSLGFFEVK